MKTIKIIDLLNKIANGEEVPKKICYEEYIWTHNGETYDNKEQCLFEDYIDKRYVITEVLNDEVEILDEEDEFEDIEEIDGFTVWGDNYMPIICEVKNKVDKLIKNQKKIIEKLKEGGKEC